MVREITLDVESQSIDSSISDALNNIKMMALYMIVCVHCCAVGDNPNSIETIMLGITSCIGMIGVPLYFFCSGFLFDCTKYKNCWCMISYKVKRLILPWACSAIYMWILENKIFHVSKTTLVEYFIGINSILWYLTVLLLFYLLTWFIRKDTLLIVVSVVGIVYHYLVIYAQITQIPLVSSALNWFPFFAIGILAKKYRILSKLTNSQYLFIPLIATGGVAICTGIKIIANSTNGYMEFCSYPLEICGLVAAAGYSCTISEEGNNFIKKLSVYNFPVYLFHLPIAIVANFVLRRYWLMNYVLPIRALLVIATTMVLLMLYQYVFKNNVFLLRIAGLKR